MKRCAIVTSIATLMILLMGCVTTSESEFCLYYEDCGHEQYIESYIEEGNYLTVPGICEDCSSYSEHNEGWEQGYKDALDDVYHFLADEGYTELAEHVRDDIR